MKTYLCVVFSEKKQATGKPLNGIFFVCKSALQVCVVVAVMGDESSMKREMDAEPQEGFLHQIFMETVSSPINIILLGLCGILIYKIYCISKGNTQGNSSDY